jgi:fatty-acyl-CoA synthase
MATDLWPARYDGPHDLTDIEKVPLAKRGLPATTYDVVRRASALWPNRVALSVLPDAARWREHTTVTFARLHTRANRVANLLHGLGVRRGDAVGLMSPNCEELVIATLASQAAGIAAPVNPALDPGHVRGLLERSGARVLVVAGPELNSAIWTVALDVARTGGLDAVLALRPTGIEGPAPALPTIDGAVVGYLSELAEHYPGDVFVGPLPMESDIAAVFHTGGTTGVPKLAAHTHANEVADAWMIAANTLLHEDSVIFAALPLFHVNALVVTLLAPLMRGQRVVWAGPDGYRDVALFNEFWAIVEHFELSTMSAVPTVYQALANVPINADVKSMRFAMVGASPLPNAVRSMFENNTGIPLLEGYGLTEATCASVRGFLDHRRPGALGVRMPYQHLKVARVERDGLWTDLPHGEVGTLLINGPNVFPGYVTAHDADGPVMDGLGKLHGGWLDTGDLARIDEDGYIYLVGRAKDLIIRGGHNIDPQVIEDALLEHPQVTGAAAVGKPDLHSGEVPVAYVTLAAESTVTPEELRVWAAEHVAEAAAAPKAITVRDSLPVTEVGKPYKPGLRIDATRRAFLEALADVKFVLGVNVRVDDGAVVAIVQVHEGVDLAAVELALGGFAVAWKVDSHGVAAASSVTSDLLESK